MPAGRETVERIISTIKADPTVPLELAVDLEVTHAHWHDIHEGALCGDRDFTRRQGDYIGRMKDLDVCRRISARPNGVYPAFEVVKWLVANITSLEGICFYKEGSREKWPECRYARLDSPKRMRGEMGLGKEAEGIGPCIFLPMRSKKELRQSKEETAQAIAQADRLFVRPHHLMCMLCVFGTEERNSPLEDDNLYEILLRMRDDPELPVTLIEGCCQVCDPCPAYYPPKNICFHSYVRDQHKDLRCFQTLGLAPGDTLPAGKLMALLYDRVTCLEEVCTGFQSEGAAQLWSTCAGNPKGYEAARSKRLLAR